MVLARVGRSRGERGETVLRWLYCSPSCSRRTLWEKSELGGGEVGGWVGWVEEDEAVRMSYCEVGVGRWVGGWRYVPEGEDTCLCAFGAEGLAMLGDELVSHH